MDALRGVCLYIYTLVERTLSLGSMGGSKGIPQYSWEYPTFLGYFHVYICVYTYI